MSGDTEPVIHTVGSVDGPDRKTLRDEISASKETIPPRAPATKLDETEDRKEEYHGDTVTGFGTRHDATGLLNSSEPGVVGEIRTVGSADPTDGDAGAST